MNFIDKKISPLTNISENQKQEYKNIFLYAAYNILLYVVTMRSFANTTITSNGMISAFAIKFYETKSVIGELNFNINSFISTFNTVNKEATLLFTKPKSTTSKNKSENNNNNNIPSSIPPTENTVNETIDDFNLESDESEE